MTRHTAFTHRDHGLTSFYYGLQILRAVIFPANVFALFLYTFIVIAVNVMGHIGFEFVPKKIRDSSIGRWFNSSTHHYMHHHKGNKNFGYYLSFWDITMKTLNKENRHDEKVKN